MRSSYISEHNCHGMACTKGAHGDVGTGGTQEAAHVTQGVRVVEPCHLHASSSRRR
jgi:hypothetical protein